MNVTTATTKHVLALALAAMLASGPALADNGKGKGNHGNSGRGDSNASSSPDKADRADNAKRDHFEDRHHVIVRDYYTEQHAAGHCPPGLAKKNNGCMPPGQAKKWNVGQPLPSNVVFYSVPQPLLVQFGPPPAGYRYVRVDSDILMMAIGTRMVVDSIKNLGRS
jgi:Ni/Co efflux regulator RcnB